jgi:hypothetical protein
MHLPAKRSVLSNFALQCVRHDIGLIKPQALRKLLHFVPHVLSHRELQPLVLVHQHCIQPFGECSRAFEVLPAQRVISCKSLSSNCAFPVARGEAEQRARREH